MPGRDRETLVNTHKADLLLDMAASRSADLIVLDSQADFFGGSEILRSHARGFISILRHKFCADGGTVLLLSHPSLTGEKSERGGSGSTGWAASVRSRLTLTRATTGEGKEIDPHLRKLAVAKANHAELSEMVLVWSNGVFQRQGNGASLDRLALERQEDETFVDLLKLFASTGQDVSPKGSASFAPKLFARAPSF